MHLEAEQIKEIEEMAYHLIEPSLIAINIEVDEAEFENHLKLRGSPVRSAYYKGYLRQLLELRRSVIKSAKNGSNPALEVLLKNIGKIEKQL